MKLMPEGGRRLRHLLKFSLTSIGVAVLASALLLDLVALSVLWKDAAAEERANWLAEYRQIRSAIEETYPNLEWTLEKAELDLVALDRDTTERIEDATSRHQAERAMRGFVDAFGDGHLSLHRPKRPDWEVEKLKVDVLSRNTPPGNACATLGYDGSRAYALPFDFAGLAPFKRFADANAFFAGVLTIDSHRVGVVRVASFDDTDYVRSCRDEWSRLRLTLDTTCERECRANLKMTVRNRLILQFESRIRQFKAAGVELVVVDLTENYGGHAWYEPLGSVLTGKDLPRPPTSLVRGSKTVAELDEYMARLDRSIALCPPPPARRRLLERNYRQLDAARTEALAPCNRGGIWSEDGAMPVCSQLTSPLPYDSDALAGLDVRPESDRRFVDTFLEPVRYRLPRVAWRGRLAVRVDRNSWSAAELLAGILQDYGGAIVIGEHSGSAGGRWHRGHSPYTFKHSRLELHVPDEVEYRRDGSNYRDGIEPDLLTGWGPDQDASEKARWLIEALRQVLETKGAQQ